MTWTPGAALPSNDGGSLRQSLLVKGRLGEYYLEIPLLGAHQLENAATAVAALEVLREQGHNLPTEAISDGFSNVFWPCRMEVLNQGPLLVVDGAHNQHSMQALSDSLPRYFNFRNLLLVAGFSRDKSVSEMASCLAGINPPDRLKVFAAASRHPRSLSPRDVAKLFSHVGVRAVENASPADAMNQALAAAGEDDLVLATGSLFLAAEVREAALGIEPELYPDLLPSSGPAL